MRLTPALLLILLATCCAPAQNLLTNPSFEQIKDGMPVGWSPAAAWYEEPKGAGLSAAAADSKAPGTPACGSPAPATAVSCGRCCHTSRRGAGRFASVGG